MPEKHVDIRVLEYDAQFMRILKDFSDDYVDVPEDKILAVADENTAVKVWQSANRWVDSGAAWGANIPGVAVDCVGSALAVAIEAKALVLPAAVRQVAMAARSRSGELEESPAVLNRRMQAFLMYTAMKCTVPGVLVVPVANPAKVYPLDIFITPYTFVANGHIIMPHAMVCVRDGKFLTANQETGNLQLVDLDKSGGVTQNLDLPGEDFIAAFVLRFYRMAPDDMYIYHKHKVLTSAKLYYSEIRGL